MKGIAILFVAGFAACSGSGRGAGDVVADTGHEIPPIGLDGGPDAGLPEDIGDDDRDASLPPGDDGAQDSADAPDFDAPPDVEPDTADDAPPIDAQPGDTPAEEVAGDTGADVVAPPGTPVLSFNADFTETLSGPFVQGGKLVIHYDWSRLPACRGTHNGCPAWTMEVFYSFDLASPAGSVSVVSHSCDSSVVDPVIDIPSDASDVWFWARNANAIEQCEAWDSNYDNNYRFPVFAPGTVAQDVAWAGGFDFVYVKTGAEVSNGDVDPAYFFASMLGSEVAVTLRVQAYAPGITDRTYADAGVAAQIAAVAMDAAVVTDLWGTGPAGQQKTVVPLAFAGTSGNNFVYEWRVGYYGYFPPDDPPEDGAYLYSMRFKTADGAGALDVGLPGGGDRTFVYAQTANCSLFPKNPPRDYCP